MSRERQIRFWLIGFAVFVALVYLLRAILLPFVAGMAVAYLLDPLCDRLEARGIGRAWGTLICLSGFFLIAILFLLLFVPLLATQALDLAEALPGVFTQIGDWVRQGLEELRGSVDPQTVADIKNSLAGTIDKGVTWLTGVVADLISGGAAVLNLISLLVIAPVVAFYLLRDWDRMVGLIDGWLPRDHAEIIREQARLVDQTLAGFVRGQASVCLVLGVFYALALVVAGLKFGFIIGIIAGFLTFIPYVGSITGFFLSVGFALVQFDEVWRIAVIAGIFFVGQAVEGNYLTPKLVGDRTNLHPVWVIFALLAGGALFGFVGVLLAVPVAAVLGVLTRFFLRQYLDSTLYASSDDEGGGSQPR